MGLYYVQTNSICMLVLLIVAMALNRTNVLPARRRAFNRLVIICFVICISDIVAWYLNGKFFAGSRALQHLFNMTYYAAITWVGYAWLKYVDLRIKRLEDNISKRWVDTVPLGIMLLVIATNPLTHMLFSIDETNTYTRESGIFVHWIISWGYLFYSTALVIIKINQAKSRTEKSQLMPMVWFVVPPAAAAVLQMFFYGLTSTQCGVTLSILIIAFNYLADDISRDALTGLNNRKALENHLIELLQRGNSDLTILMCDIDRFKTINDTLGHTAGDLVLKRMSDGLKKVCGNFPGDAFLCRYGGDEFIVCCRNMGEGDADRLTASIEQAIADVNADYSDNLSFGISVGHVSGQYESYKDVEGLIALADAAMYEIKTKKKAARA